MFLAIGRPPTVAGCAQRGVRTADCLADAFSRELRGNGANGPVGILGPYLGGDLLLKRRPLALSLVRGGRGS